LLKTWVKKNGAETGTKDIMLYIRMSTSEAQKVQFLFKAVKITDGKATINFASGAKL
jgi:hypothetical protein